MKRTLVIEQHLWVESSCEFQSLVLSGHLEADLSTSEAFLLKKSFLMEKSSTILPSTSGQSQLKVEVCMVCYTQIIFPSNFLPCPNSTTGNSSCGLWHPQFLKTDIPENTTPCGLGLLIVYEKECVPGIITALGLWSGRENETFRMRGKKNDVRSQVQISPNFK